VQAAAPALSTSSGDPRAAGCQAAAAAVPAEAGATEAPATTRRAAGRITTSPRRVGAEVAVPAAAAPAP